MLGYYMLILTYCNILIYCQHPACTQLFYNRHSSFFTSLSPCCTPPLLQCLPPLASYWPSAFTSTSYPPHTLASTSNIHGQLAVQTPKLGPRSINTTPSVVRYPPISPSTSRNSINNNSSSKLRRQPKGKILDNPTEFSHSFRTFLSFSGHPGDLITALYTPQRVPKQREDFPHIILQEIPIQPSGQLCVNVTLQPFDTHIGDMGVMYFEARDPRTGVVVEYHVSFFV